MKTSLAVSIILLTLSTAKTVDGTSSCLCCTNANEDTLRISAELPGEVVDLIRHPSTVERFGVEYVDMLTYGKSSVPTLLSEDNVAALSSVLLKDESYMFSSERRCPFTPETAFVFRNGLREVTVFISISARKLRFVSDSGFLTQFDVSPGFEVGIELG